MTTTSCQSTTAICLRLCRGLFLALALAPLGAATAQGATYALGTTNVLEGPSADTNSVVLAVDTESATWAATADAPWLHLSVAYQSGTGSTNVVFTCDTNAGPTRSGTLTIAGQTLNVTQAGSTYVTAPGPVTTLNSGCNHPEGLAVDKAGNVYIADSGHAAIKKWTAANNSITTLDTLQDGIGLGRPWGIAVDGAGNVYIADNYYKTLRKWTVNNTLITLVNTGLNNPRGIAVDKAGNVYIAEYNDGAIKKWSAADKSLTTLIGTGLSGPSGVALDEAGNLYIADTYSQAIKKWTAASSNLTTLWGYQGFGFLQAVAVDGAGNIYAANRSDNTIQKFTVANNKLTTLAASGLNQPYGVAVDRAGNVYIADTYNNAIKELPRAFVDPTPKQEGPEPDTDTLPMVLPPTANLRTPFSPSTNQPWLRISGVTNGVVSFSFDMAPSNRVGTITVLGRAITVNQRGPTYRLGVTNALEGPAASTNTVILVVFPQMAPWTATANAPWLHLDPANQSGSGNSTVLFTLDANPGPTRTGTLTIGDQTLTVTQAGATYVAAPGPVTALVDSGLNKPQGVAVDKAGNVYIADMSNNAIKKWSPTNNATTTLVDSGLYYPYGVAVDGAGNVYIADTYNNAIKKWSAIDSNVTTLVESGLKRPTRVALDGAGNVYIADALNNAVKVWTTNGTLTTLIDEGLYYPWAVAVDTAGDLYIADAYNNAIKKWSASDSNVVTVISSGLDHPMGIAVDGAGNLYIADTLNNATKKWSAASQTLSTLASSSVLNYPADVAVDAAGNLYIADRDHNAVKELPRAFVDPTAKLEYPNPGTDTLPVVLPPTANLQPPFGPTTNQPWLAIKGTSNGVVSFSFTAATADRTANITLLGQTIAITQAGPLTPPTLVRPGLLTNGHFQFAFSNSTPGATFTVLSSTNAALPLASWTVLGAPTNSAPGVFQFSTPVSGTEPQRFYRVRSP